MAVPKKRSARRIKNSKLKYLSDKLKLNNNILKYKNIYTFKKITNGFISVFYL